MKINIMQRLIIAFTFLSTSLIKAQPFFDYNNRHLSQSHLWNPGFLPQYKVSLGFGLNENVSLVGGNLNSWFNSTETNTQTVARLINEKEKQIGIDNLTAINLFHFGFRSAKSYFSVNSSVINEASVRLPKDLLGLAFFGNGAFIENDAKIDFSGSRLRSYVQNTLSYGRQINNEWSAGVNVGIINGIADVGIYDGRFNIQTDTGVASIYQLGIEGQIDGKASLLGGDLERAITDSAYDLNQAIQDGMGNIGFGTNQGLNIGFGAVYRMNERLRFSGSVQNIGSITWNTGAQEIKMNPTTWVWNGLDTNQISNLNDGVIQQLQDTIQSKFDLQSGKINQYTTTLQPRYILGAEYFITPRTYLQLMGGYGFGIQGDRGFVGGTAHQEIDEFIDLRFSYSYYDFNNAAHRLGAGFSLNLGPIQIHASVQDVLGVASYGSSNSVTAMLGMNINIGTWKDRDNDMVPDKRDSCYKDYGVISNDGCPYGFLGGSMNYDEPEEDDITEATSLEEELEEEVMHDNGSASNDTMALNNEVMKSDTIWTSRDNILDGEEPEMPEVSTTDSSTLPVPTNTVQNDSNSIQEKSLTPSNSKKENQSEVLVEEKESGIEVITTKSSEASHTKSNQIKTLSEDKKKQLEALMKR